MAGEAVKGDSKVKKESTAEVKFKCRLCNKERPISEMKIIARFRPVVVVCQECESSIR